MRELLIASGNPGKIAEICSLLEDLPLRLINPRALGIELEVEEDGDTYADNARLKALAYASATMRWALADDSGLEVDQLNGAPGLLSARLTGPGGSDADRRAHLLRLLSRHPGPWRARFRCTVALASPQGTVDITQGTCEGVIIPEARGESGFGYDPIFLLDTLGKTMAELSIEEKNQLSHRAKAVKALLPTLSERLGI